MELLEVMTAITTMICSPSVLEVVEFGHHASQHQITVCLMHQQHYVKSMGRMNC